MAAHSDGAAAAWFVPPLQFPPAQTRFGNLGRASAEDCSLDRAVPTRLQFKFSRSSSLTATSSPVALHLAFQTCSDIKLLV